MVRESSDYPSRLNGRYHLLQIIGSGGMGVVWRAHDEVLNRQVACKVLSHSSAGDPVFQQRFEREARHVASLSHPNIVTVFDSGADGDVAFIVMEYVRGSSLRSVLGALAALPVTVTAALAVDVLSALAHAHDRGIIHRDVKPANLLLESAGTVKVADFGIAKSMGEVTDLTTDGAFVGTATYASPEQLSGRTLGPSSDLYSLGCVLFQCLAGQLPYATNDDPREGPQSRSTHRRDLAEFRSDVPAETSLAIDRALAEDPSDRFKTAMEMRDVFIPLANEESLHQLLSRSQLADSDDETERSELQKLALHPQAFNTAKPRPSVTPRPAPAVSRKSMRRTWSFVGVGIVGLLLIAGVLLAFLTLGGAGTAGPRSTIPSGGYLQPGHSIRSSNGRFTLVMQTDGNLVEYGSPGKTVKWESGTSGNFGAYVVMQADGNLVVYPPGKTAPAPGQPTPALWDSGTAGHPGSSAALLNSGHLVVLVSRTGDVLWRTPLQASM